MARFSIAILVLLSACGNAVVNTTSTPGYQDPNALLPGALDGDAGSEDAFDAGDFDAGPPTSILTGKVVLPDGQGANGATVTLMPADQETTVEGSDYLFDAAPLGPFTLTVKLAGYQTATRTGILTDAGLSEKQITLEASWPLFAPDGGFSATWMAFAPDAGPLYAADDGSFWNIATDGGASTPLTTGSPTVQPLGFATDGTPVYLADYQPLSTGGIDGGSATLELGQGIALSLGFMGPGPFLVGDSVYMVQVETAPTGSMPAIQEWYAYSASSPNPTAAVTEAYATPAAQPTSSGLVGYRPTITLDGLFLGSFFSTGPSGAMQDFATTATWTGPEAIGVSSDGTLAAFEVAVPTSAGVPTTSWQIAVLSASGTSTVLSGQLSLAQLSQITAIVPLSAGAAVELLNNGTFLVDGARKPASYKGTEVVPLPNEAFWYLDSSGLEDGLHAAIPLNGSWSQPVISPDFAHVVFPGIPMVIDVATWTPTALAETPQTALFGAGGSELLIVGTDGSLHVVTFPAAGPADAQLEGTATLALFTPDGTAVVYAGTDPNGSSGIFEQPATPPAAQPQAAGAVDGGATIDGGA